MDEPFILSTLIAGITQKPVSQISEQDLDFVLGVLSADFVVPLLVDGAEFEDLNLTLQDLTAIKMLIEDLLLYCPWKEDILEIIDRASPYETTGTVLMILDKYMSLPNLIDETKNKIIDNIDKHFDKKDMINQAEQVISIYNAFQTGNDSIVNSSFEETIKKICFGDAECSLAELYRCYLHTYDSLISDVDFYESLDDYEIETLMKLINIMGEVSDEDERLDLMLERVYSQLAKAAVNNDDLMDKVVALLGETVLFFTSCMETILTNAVLNNNGQGGLTSEHLLDIMGDVKGINSSFDLLLEKMHDVAKIKNATETVLYDPLVVDMGKTGFELTDVENGTHFDMDANGLAEKTGWITGDDAFLALDRNGDGTINDSGELFGDRTLLKDGTFASSGFEALAEFDDDLNRIINAHDAVYDQLVLWQDKNHDGIATPDELMTLAEAGIEAINLNYDSVNNTDDESGSNLANISSVVFEDGTETAIGEFKFHSDKIDTKDIINFEFSEEILALPDVRAVGGIHSLHYAMAMDSTGELKELVTRFVNSSDVNERSNIVEQILYFLCNAGDIAPDSRGSYVDARHLAVIEIMTDGGFVGFHGPNPSYLAGSELERAYDMLLNAYYNDMAMPSIGKYLNFILEKTDENGNKYNDMSLFNPYVGFHLNKGEISEVQFADMSRVIFSKDINAFLDFKIYFSTGDYSFGELIEKSCGGVHGTDNGETLFASAEGGVVFGYGGDDIIHGSDNNDILFGGSGNDALYDNNGNDVLDGGEGDDNLRGGLGDDTYIFGKGYGTDRMEDWQGLNKIKFTDLNIDDLKVYKSGWDDLTIEVIGTNDKLIIQRYFNSLLNSDLIYEFADGTVWNYENMTNHLRTMYGTDGNDTLNPLYDSTTFYGLGGDDGIYGSDGSDVLDGGEGDDNLRGGLGDDTYIFGNGYGTDRMEDWQGLNTIKFTDLNIDDLKVYKSGWDDLTIEVIGTDDKLIIQRYFNSLLNSDLIYEFADGTVWNYENMTNHLRTMYGTDGNDTLNPLYDSTTFYGLGGDDGIYGSDGNDILDGGEGDDILRGGLGDDTYIFGKGYGMDRMEDWQGLNTIKFTDLNIDDLKVYKSGWDDLTIEVIGTDDKLIIQRYFNDLKNSDLIYEFADGIVTTLDKNSLKFDRPYSEDNYAFSVGEGLVQIEENGGEDTLQINADILNTIFYREGDNLNIMLNNSEDVLTVDNWFADSVHQIEIISSGDGYSLSNNQVQLLIENMASYTENNKISWTEAIQQDSVGV